MTYLENIKKFVSKREDPNIDYNKLSEDLESNAETVISFFKTRKAEFEDGTLTSISGALFTSLEEHLKYRKKF